MGRSLEKRHAMLEFGTVHGATQEIRVNRLESRLAPVVPFPHRHDFYHLVVISAGRSGWHEIDFENYDVAPGHAYFMKPGQVHSWDFKRGTRGFVIEFGHSQKNPSSWSMDKLPDQITLPKSVLPLLERMLTEYEKRAPEFELALQHYLMPLLIELYRASPRRKERKLENDPLLERFLLQVETHFRKEHGVTFYAQELRTTPKALTMRVSRGLGKSARTVIQERLLLEGKRLLAYSNLTVSEVGYKIGFEDPNYFSRFFRSETGSSPGDFKRRQVRAK